MSFKTWHLWGATKKYESLSVLDERGVVLTSNFFLDICNLEYHYSIILNLIWADHISNAWQHNSQTGSYCEAVAAFSRIQVDCSTYRKLKHQLRALLPIKEDQTLIKVEIELQHQVAVSSGHLLGSCLNGSCVNEQQQQTTYFATFLRKTIDKETFFIR